MKTSIIRSILWAHTAIAGAAGLVFYLAPGAAASWWPWPLPGLAARFVGALLISGAVYSGLTAMARTSLPVAGMLLTASGYSLIALVAILHGDELRWTTALIGWAAIWAVVALIFAVLLIVVQSRQPHGIAVQMQLPLAVSNFFNLILFLVNP